MDLRRPHRADLSLALCALFVEHLRFAVCVVSCALSPYRLREMLFMSSYNCHKLNVFFFVFCFFFILNGSRTQTVYSFHLAGVLQ